MGINVKSYGDNDGIIEMKSIIEFILSIEENVDVSSLNYKNLNVWPYLRSKIYSVLHGYSKPFHYSKGVHIESESSNSLKGLFSNAFYSYKYYKEHKKSIQHYIEGFPSDSRINLNPADILFAGISSHRSEQIDGKYFHRTLDSLKLVLGDQFTSLTVEEIVDDNKLFPCYTPVYPVLDQFLGLLYLNRFKDSIRNEKFEIEGFDKLNAYLKQFNLDLTIEYPYFKADLDGLISDAQYFDQLLKQVKPKVVIIDIWIHRRMFSLIIAAKRLKIKVIEVQHGVQASYGPYSFWNSVQEANNLFFPNCFWVWSQENYRSINNWSKKAKDIDVIEGGFPFITICDQGLVETDNEPLNLSKTKKNVLVTLQKYLPEQQKEFDDKLLSAIKTLGDEVKWYFRAHPHYAEMNRKWVEDKVALLNVEYTFHEPKEQLMYEILGKFDAHLTYHSTVIMESQSVGVLSILIGESDFYENFMEDDYFKMVKSGEELVDLLRNEVTWNKKPIIKSDRETMINIVRDLIQKK